MVMHTGSHKAMHVLSVYFWPSPMPLPRPSQIQSLKSKTNKAKVIPQHAHPPIAMCSILQPCALIVRFALTETASKFSVLDRFSRSDKSCSSKFGSIFFLKRLLLDGSCTQIVVLAFLYAILGGVRVQEGNSSTQIVRYLRVCRSIDRFSDYIIILFIDYY